MAFSVSAGADLQVTPGGTVTRTAVETGTPSPAVASRAWTLNGGPAQTADLSVAAQRYGWGVPLSSSDEFGYTGAPNSSKWSVYNGPGHAGNGLRSPSRVTVNGTSMVLTGLAGSANTAGLAHKTSLTQMRVEVRCRSSVTGSTGTDDYHVVLILWPEDDAWPEGGEIDFLEVGTPGAADAEAYWHYPSLDGNNTQEHFTKAGVDLGQWHNYAVELSSSGIVSWIDGVEWSRKSGGATSKRRAIQDVPGPMQLTVQLDAFSSSGLRASQMELDWVRVYPIVPQGGTSTGGTSVGTTIGSAAALSWTAPTTVGVYPLTYSALDAAGNVLASDVVNVEVVTSPSTGGGGGGGTGGGTGGVPVGTAIVIEPDPIPSTEAFGVPTLEFETTALPEVPTFPGSGLFPGVTTFPRGSLDPRFRRQRTGWTLYPGPGTFPGEGTWPGWGIAGEDPPPFDVELILLDAGGRYRCPLPDVAGFTLTDVENSDGSVSFDYPTAGINFDALREHVDDGVDALLAVRFAGSSEWEMQAVLSECDGDDVADAAVWQFRGAWSEALLDEAVVYPDPGSSDGKVGFVDATPGQIVTELVARAQMRGALDIDTSTFSAETDSHGQPWPTDTISSPAFAPGDSSTYLRVLQLLADAGLCEFEMRGRSLRLYRPGGRGFDRTVGTPVVLQAGRDLLEASRRHTVRGSVTSLLVLGGDGDWTEVADDTALGRRGRRVEGATSQGSLTGGALRAYGRAKLVTAAAAQAERVHKLALVDGNPMPVRDFDVGDLVWSDSDGQRRALRVAQWTLTLNEQGLSGSVSLGDLIDDPLLKLARKLLGIGDGSTVTGGGTGTKSVEGLTPAAPSGLTVDSVTSPTADGSSSSTLLISWDPVVLATDGISGVDVTGYRLRWRYTVAAGAQVPVPLVGEWVVLDDLDTSTSAQIEGVVPAAQVEVQVAAFSVVTTTVTPPDTGGDTGGGTDTGGGDTGGGTTTPPVVVGTTMPDILRLGKAAGLTKCNLGVDFKSGDNSSGHAGVHYDYTLAAIEADLVVPGYAEIRPDGAVRLTSYVGAATTPNSTHSRTEYRELGTDGVAKAAWSSKSGRHYVWCRGAIIKLPKGRQRACIAQIHTPDDDLCMILVDQGTNVESTYGDTGRPGRLTSSLVLGQVYEWMIELVREDSQTVINYYWQDMTTPKATQPYSGGDGLYAKWGNYQQSSTQYDSAGETCIVDLYDCEVWHTGYPAPKARNATTSGGSTGGSTGGTGGSTGGGGTATQTLGVGGIPAPAAGSGVVLISGNSSSTLNITQSNVTYDGGGHTVPKITIAASNVTVQNFVVRGGTNSGVYSIGTGNVIQNCDIGGIKSDGDVNGITFFGDGHKILYNKIGDTVDLLSGAANGSHTDGIQTWNTSSKRSSSNILIKGNRIVGPDASNERYLHQGVQAEDKDSTDGGGGGTGVSQNWTITENYFKTYGNQCLHFMEKFNNVTISKNTFAGACTKIVARASSTGVTFAADNIITGSYGTTVGD